MMLKQSVASLTPPGRAWMEPIVGKRARHQLWLASQGVLELDADVAVYRVLDPELPVFVVAQPKSF